MATQHRWPEAVALAALRAYAALPERGKPRHEEWTVLAAFVVEDTAATGCEKSRFRAVTLATGNKCVGPAVLATAAAAGVAGGLLHDSHAEVLARRALLRLLYNELKLILGHSGTSTTFASDLLLEEDDEHYGKHLIPEAALNDIAVTLPDPCCASSASNYPEDSSGSSRRKFRLRRGLRLHLYISEAPCGDAALFELAGGSLNFTGAKLVEGTACCASIETVSTAATASAAPEVSSGDLQVSQSIHSRSGGPPSSAFSTVPGRDKAAASSSELGLREPGAQVLGAARLKSGRSDLRDSDRTLSMSCSDKLTRWCLLGLQGSLLSRWMREPLFLASIVVSKDPRAASPEAFAHALQRAIPDRASAAQARARAARAVVDTSEPDAAALSAAEANAAPSKKVEGQMGTELVSAANALNGCHAVPTVHVVDATFEASMQSRLAAAAATHLPAASVVASTDDSSSATLQPTAVPSLAAAAAVVTTVPASIDDTTKASVCEGLQAETSNGDNGESRPKKRRKQVQNRPSVARSVPSGLCINWVATLPFRAIPSKQAKNTLPSVAGTVGVKADIPVASGTATWVAHFQPRGGAVAEIPVLAGEVEVTVGASGRRQGAATKGPSATAPATRSRLCKEHLFAQWREGVAADMAGTSPSSTSAITSSSAGSSSAKATYLACKEACGHGRRALVTGSAPLIPQWVCTPVEYDCFEPA